MGFDLIEMWVENAFMLEIATAAWSEEYLGFMNGEPARTMFGLQRAG